MAAIAAIFLIFRQQKNPASPGSSTKGKY